MLNGTGQAPIHLAVNKGYGYMVEVLVGCDADVNGKNLDGETSLHLALKEEKRVKVSWDG